MSPGSTVRFDASITSVPDGQPAAGPAVVTASIRPLSIWITASRTAVAPVPSIRVPARTIFMALLSGAALGGLHGLLALEALLLDHPIREVLASPSRSRRSGPPRSTPRRTNR